jgi:hypothetical protein
MTKKYSKLLYPDWLQIMIPEDWHNEELDGILNLYSSEGYGSLQISFGRRYKKDNDLKIHMNEIIKLHLLDNNLSKDKVEIHISNKINYLVSELEYLVDQDYWRIWHFLDMNRLVFITYNCNKNYKDSNEKEVIDKIISSIEFIK